jgi:hypothetical protein
VKGDPIVSLFQEIVYGLSVTTKPQHRGEWRLAGANFRVKLVFKLVFFLPSGPGRVRLRPEVFHLIRAAKLKRDEMVNFAAVRSSSPAVFLVHLVAHPFGDVAMLVRPSRRANIGCRGGWQCVAGRKPGIGQSRARGVIGE